MESVELQNKIYIKKYTGSILIDTFVSLLKNDNDTLKYNLLCFIRGLYRLIVFDFKREKYLSDKDKNYCNMCEVQE